MLTLLSFVVVIGVIIFVHELGHFLAARSVGIRVEQFSLGYPPKMVSWKRGETEYRLSWIPLGGYVKMSGMIDESGGDESTLTGAPWEFASKRSWQKIWVVLAGVLMNFILAVLLYTGITAVKGVPEYKGPFVGTLTPGGPAESAGLEYGDRILSIDGVELDTCEDLTDAVYPRPGETLRVAYERDGEAHEVAIETLTHEMEVEGEWREVGLIGVNPQYTYRPANLEEVLTAGVQGTARVIELVGQSIYALVTGKASVKDLGGPILIAKMSGQSAREGLGYFLNFIAFISINIGCLNLLPIPALDGGHAVIILLEGAIRRELPTRLKIALQNTGMILLLALILFILWNDAMRVFNFGWIKQLF